MDKHDQNSMLGIVFILFCILGMISGYLGPIYGAIFSGILSIFVMSFLLYLEKKENILHKHVVVAPAYEERIEIDWPEQIKQIEKAMKSGNYDFARTWLQKLAYTISSKNVPVEFHARFKELMISFAHEDPLYSKVISLILPVIKLEPGILQSDLMKKFTQFNPDEFRYVLYFSAEIGTIVRVKKGRSYALFLPEKS